MTTIKYPLAVISKYCKDYAWYVKYHKKDPKKCIWISDMKSTYGRYYRGFTIVGPREHLPDEIDHIIEYIEYHTKLSIDDCLERLEEKRKVLHWLIDGLGKTGLTFDAVHWLTIDRICELYNTEPEYFENC